MVRYLFYTIGDLTYQSPLVVNTFAGIYIHSSSITPSECYRLAGFIEWNNGLETIVISLLSFLKTH